MQLTQFINHIAIGTVQITRHLIHDVQFCHRHRNTDRAFTRRRTLTFMNVVVLLLQKTVRSIQVHLNDFFRALVPEAGSVSPASWSEARLKLRHTAFIELNERAILEPVYGEQNTMAVRRWKGLRLLGIDSSLIRLPNRQALGEEFGWVECSNQAGGTGRYPQGRLSVLTDLLNRIALDTRLVPWQQGERNLALEHFQAIKPEDLAILDRGFASYDLFAHFVARQGLFVCRCPKSSFSPVDQLFEQNQAGCSVVVTLSAPKKNLKQMRQAGLPEEITVRLVTVRLDTGELEVLATNLLDTLVYASCEFKQLYHQRWGIETYYGLLKGRLDLENFTGQSAEAVRQDVYSTIFLSNVESVLVQEGQAQLDQKSAELEHPQQINHAVSFHTLKSHIIDLLLGSEPVSEVLPRLQRLFLGNPVSHRQRKKVPRTKRSGWRSYHYQRHIRKVVF